MIEYKVGGKVFICISTYWKKLFNGYADIEKVSRKYAEVRASGFLYVISMKDGRVIDIQDKKSIIGTVYSSEEEFIKKCAVEKFAKTIKNTVNNIGYRGFHECSMEDLRKIADILKINLNE